MYDADGLKVSSLSAKLDERPRVRVAQLNGSRGDVFGDRRAAIPPDELDVQADLLVPAFVLSDEKAGIARQENPAGRVRGGFGRISGPVRPRDKSQYAYSQQDVSYHSESGTVILLFPCGFTSSR